MRKFALTAMLAALIVGLPTAAQATPAEDLQEFRDYFTKRFPGVPLNEYQNGVYAINADARSSWESIEEFPPYEDALR